MQALQSDFLLRLAVSVLRNFLDELMCSPRMVLPEESTQEDFFLLQKWVSSGLSHSG